MKSNLFNLSIIAALALSPLAAISADEVTPGKSSTSTSTTITPPQAPASVPAGNGGTITTPVAGENGGPVTTPADNGKNPGKSSTSTDVPANQGSDAAKAGDAKAGK